jgi:ABC-type multidrug transport system fused ATPase/permease subunit
LSAIGLTAVFVKGAAGVYATYAQSNVAAEVGNELRLSLLDAIFSRAAVTVVGREAGQHDQGGALGGNLGETGVSALTDHIREVELGLRQGLLGGIRACAQLIPLLLVLFALSQRMAVVGLATLLGFGVLLGRTRGSFRRATKTVLRERSELLEAADECVRHADLWVAFGAQRKARTSLRRVGEALARGGAMLDARATAMSAANEVLAAAALVVALAAARAGWLGPAEREGALLGFAVAFFLAYRPVRDLAEARLAWLRGQTALGTLGEAARGTSHEVQGPDAIAHAPPRSWPLASLELRELTLARGCREPLSLRLEPGTVLAVLGATGAGKTTLLRTLLGLEDAAKGEILYAGEPLAHAPCGPAHRPFTWVPQEAPMLADTLAANIALGATARIENVSEALDAIGARRLIARVEEKTLGGRGLSGGERQWIALARALATGLPVLLLDEPTSGLDAASQERVLEAIRHLRGRRTIVLVTHRPEPLAVADVVLRIGEGETLERAA